MQRRPGLNVAASYTHVCGFHTHTSRRILRNPQKKKTNFQVQSNTTQSQYIGEHSAHILVSFRSHMCVCVIYIEFGGRRRPLGTWKLSCAILCNFLASRNAECGDCMRAHVGFAPHFAHAGFLICTQFGVRLLEICLSRLQYHGGFINIVWCDNMRLLRSVA